MTISDNITNYIKEKLKKTAPSLTKDQIERRNKILNSDNPNFKGYGHKISEIEKILKDIKNEYQCAYKDAVDVFKNLIKSNTHEEKFAAVFFLNLFKKNFNKNTISIFHDEFKKYCDTWAICDSTMIRIIGPFLGKIGNEDLAKKTIDDWSNSEDLWINRASMVILLKIIMLKKDYFVSESYMFDLAEKMLQDNDDYILKGVGWLLKTYSKYNPEVITKYLNKNKKRLPRLVLRYASEKLPKETRQQILRKET